ncbi:hypothetical protein DFP72DRAFT_616995 [Ephemerocybe angulata]|uniref:Uncharacterized protein n=1 Tax=Ephemerocybe angulata TaxID=980116 RepID=A0A8H6HJG5_9AGAR|nr:hypothetical protein DFP72DRAFT_616995 [Tulosesus angulatus]
MVCWDWVRYSSFFERIGFDLGAYSFTLAFFGILSLELELAFIRSLLFKFLLHSFKLFRGISYSGLLRFGIFGVDGNWALAAFIFRFLKFAPLCLLRLFCASRLVLVFSSSSCIQRPSLARPGQLFIPLPTLACLLARCICSYGCSVIRLGGVRAWAKRPCVRESWAHGVAGRGVIAAARNDNDDDDDDDDEDHNRDLFFYSPSSSLLLYCLLFARVRRSPFMLAPLLRCYLCFIGEVKHGMDG